MTPVERLREMMERATPGPWYAADWGYDDGSNLVTIEAREPEVVSEGQSYIWPDRICKLKVATTEEGQNPLSDAALIAAAVNALPALLACAEALESLTGASIEDFGEPGDYPDDEQVAYPESAVTFGHLRKALAALSALAAQEKAP